MGLRFLKVPAVNPSVKNQRFLPAPFHKGAFLRSIDTGRGREVTITDQLGAKLSAGTARRAKLSAATGRKAPLRKGAGKNL